MSIADQDTSIRAAEFVEAARSKGFSLYAGVPCSYLKPFINYVIDDAHLTYVSSANEGDAVATASGAALGGQRAIAMMQNSGLGNAISPLTSLNYVFRLPILLIVTWRGDPDVPDEPQHELMGQITGELLDSMRIPWEYFPSKPEQIEPALRRAIAHMDETGRPFALLMRKGTVSAYGLRESGQVVPAAAHHTCSGEHGAAALSSRTEALAAIIRHTPQEQGYVLIATTGFTGRELFALNDRENQLYMVGSMGCASSLALGLSLSRPDLKVVVVDGDGAALMRMGNLATIGSYGRANLTHILLDNGVHDSTGGQATVSANVDFAAVAQACGYGLSLRCDSLSELAGVFSAQAGGPRFAHLRTQPGAPADLPRPKVTPAQVKARLMAHLASIEVEEAQL